MNGIRTTVPTVIHPTLQPTELTPHTPRVLRDLVLLKVYLGKNFRSRLPFAGTFLMSFFLSPGNTMHTLTKPSGPSSSDVTTQGEHKRVSPASPVAH